MDLKDLISRVQIAASLRVKPQTIAKCVRLGLFPEPTTDLSDRLIMLYDRDEVRRAIERREASRSRRIAPSQHGA